MAHETHMRRRRLPANQSTYNQPDRLHSVVLHSAAQCYSECEKV